MAKPKATHYGECQCCGSRQKLPGGTLALHGYTVNKGNGYGFFQGTCPGSGYRPFEQATDLIQQFIRTTEKRRDWLQSTVDAIRSTAATDDTKVWLHIYVPATWTVKRSYYRWIEVSMTMKTKKTDSGHEFCDFYYTDEHGKELELRDPYNYGYPKCVAALAQNANEKYAQSLVDEIQKAERYIDWQSKRVREWMEKPLTAIDK
jgi:hypothetical protein